MYTPIVLFAYKRIETLRSTVESLLKNPLAKESSLRIYCDQALDEKEEPLVKNVRKYVATISGFKEKKVFFQNSHQGCFNSIVNGVSETLRHYENIIVVEDDLLVSSDFLSFMNYMLNYFKKTTSIFSVTGYSPDIRIHPQHPYDVYFFPRGSSYGWGTWKDRWEKVDWQTKDFDSFIFSSKKIKDFAGGGNDLPWLLLMQKKQLLDSWAIVWAYSHYKHKTLCVFPNKAKVTSIGFGTDATHTRQKSPLFFTSNVHTHRTSEYIIPKDIKEDKKISATVRKIYGPKITNALRFLIIKLKKLKKTKKYPSFIGICNFTFTKPGGLEKRFVRITERIARTHDCKCIVSENIRNIVGKEIEAKFTPISIKPDSLSPYLLNCLLRFAKTLKYIPKFGQHIIFYSSSLSFIDLLPGVIGKIVNKSSLLIIIIPDEKQISKIMDTSIYNFLYTKLMFLNKLLINHFADLVITFDKNCKNSLAKIYPECKIVINRLALDYIPDNKNRVRQEEYDAVFIGRFSISKGIIDLLEIWSKVVNLKPNSNLAIVGPEFDLTANDLEKIITDKGLRKKIILKNFIPKNQLYDTIALSRMLILPSHYEGFALPIAEALSLSKPVITYSLSNLTNIYKDGVLFVEHDDIDTFAKKIIYLLQNDNIRIDLGKKGNNFIKRLLNWDEVAENELNLMLNAFNDITSLN